MKKIFIVFIIAAAFSVITAGCSLFNRNEEAPSQVNADISDRGETSEDAQETAETDTEEDNRIEDTDAGEDPGGEYFVSAILKGVDLENNIIRVEQLINDPDETEIEPEVSLAPDYKVVRSDLNIEDSDEKYTDITLEEIPLESEIGIMLGGDDMAQLIIYQVIEDISGEEILGNTVLGFLDAVAADEEYDYFSTATVSIVGTEEEYRNGDNSDIYFIIKESHSSWENVQVIEVRIDGDQAEVDIRGDRMAEGTKYEGDMVTFRLVNEQGIWKIDFTS